MDEGADRPSIDITVNAELRQAHFAKKKKVTYAACRQVTNDKQPDHQCPRAGAVCSSSGTSKIRDAPSS
eukprot:gene12969-biopygen6670